MKWIVTGAAGFIGCNTVAALLARGDQVVGIGDLSRPGTDRNLAWLEARADGAFAFQRCDVRNESELGRMVTVVAGRRLEASLRSSG